MQPNGKLSFPLHTKADAPHDVIIYKGSDQASLSRGFVEYVTQSQMARDIIEWFADTLCPDEYLWPTMNHNAQLKAPGSYKGELRKLHDLSYLLWKDV